MGRVTCRTSSNKRSPRTFRIYQKLYSGIQIEEQVKIIIDTGVVISAAKGSETDKQLIMSLLVNPGVQVLISKEILSEYMIVLHRPKLKIDKGLAEFWLEQFNSNAFLSETASYTKFNRDRKDAKFVNLAIHTSSQYIISLDNDLLKADLPRGIKCVKPAEFAKLFFRI